MLVLSRKTDESIVIDDNIKVVIVAIQGLSVKLGIQAPLNVPVQRSEIQQRIARETQTPALRGANQK
jgi:carbon storage regulator